MASLYPPLRALLSSPDGLGLGLGLGMDSTLANSPPATPMPASDDAVGVLHAPGGDGGEAEPADDSSGNATQKKKKKKKKKQELDIVTKSF